MAAHPTSFLRRGESARRKAVRGFTVIEALVALTLLGIVGGTLLALQASSQRLARQVIEKETAFWLARSRLVEAAAYPDRAPPEDSAEDRYEGINYLTRIEYRDVPPWSGDAAKAPGGTARLIEIRVIVSWGEAPPRSLQLSAYRRAS